MCHNEFSGKEKRREKLALYVKIKEPAPIGGTGNPTLGSLVRLRSWGKNWAKGQVGNNKRFSEEVPTTL